jgi:hypothetical protein
MLEAFFIVEVQLKVENCCCACSVQDQAYGKTNRLCFFSKVLNCFVCSVCGKAIEDNKNGS